LHFRGKRAYIQFMSSRELVIDLVNKLPEDAPLADIAREIELLAGIQAARDQARRGEGIPAEEARKLVDSWALK
jgi:predicted MarR family transcription regulator